MPLSRVLATALVLGIGVGTACSGSDPELVTPGPGGSSAGGGYEAGPDHAGSAGPAGATRAFPT
jgi:hypothetical protein